MTYLTTPAGFFAEARKNDLLGPTLTQEEVNGCNAIIAACGRADWGLSWTSYALGTAMLETAGTMHPIAELGGAEYKRRLYDITGTRPALAKQMGNTTPGDGVKYAGRGYPQLTWKTNYDKADAALAKAGLIKRGELVAKPDRAMEYDIAAFIMIWGMSTGAFTGKKLADYLPADMRAVEEAQYVQPRRIINSLDRAGDVAHFAFRFQQGLHAGGWA